MTQASVKNFQLVDEEDEETVLLQFGKVRLFILQVSGAAMFFVKLQLKPFEALQRTIC